VYAAATGVIRGRVRPTGVIAYVGK